MRKKNLISNCSNENIKKTDCIMNFVASKMNCIVEWEKSYFNKNVTLCKSKEDLKLYFTLRKNIYKGFYNKGLNYLLLINSLNFVNYFHYF